MHPSGTGVPPVDSRYSGSQERKRSSLAFLHPLSPIVVSECPLPYESSSQAVVSSVSPPSARYPNPRRGRAPEAPAPARLSSPKSKAPPRILQLRILQLFSHPCRSSKSSPNPTAPPVEGASATPPPALNC